MGMKQGFELLMNMQTHWYPDLFIGVLFNSPIGEKIKAYIIFWSLHLLYLLLSIAVYYKSIVYINGLGHNWYHTVQMPGPIWYMQGL